MHPQPCHVRFAEQLQACIDAVFARKAIDGTLVQTLNIPLTSCGVVRLSKPLAKKISAHCKAMNVHLSYSPVAHGYNVIIDLQTVTRTVAQANL